MKVGGAVDIRFKPCSRPNPVNNRHIRAYQHKHTLQASSGLTSTKQLGSLRGASETNSILTTVLRFTFFY